MRILFLTDSFPAQNCAASGRYFNLIKRVSQKHRVHLISFIRHPDEVNHIPLLKNYCASVETVLIRNMPRKMLALKALLSGAPPMTRYFVEPEMEAKLRRFFLEHTVDIVQIEHAYMAPYVRAIPEAARCKKILTLHNIGPVWFKRMFRVEKALVWKAQLFWDWLLSRWWEKKICESFDRCIALSETDVDFLKQMNPRLNVSLVRHGVDVSVNKRLPLNQGSKEILIMGDYRYLPNRDSLLHFCREVFPWVYDSINDVRLTVVGKSPPPDIHRYIPSENLKVTGYVQDVVPYYQDPSLLVVPLRAGSGVRGKILESMALGRPVVSTSLGAEGIDVTNGENILIADTPWEFAEHIVRLMNDQDLRKKITDNARRLVEEKYSWDTIAEDQLRIYDTLCPSEEDPSLAHFPGPSAPRRPQGFPSSLSTVVNNR